MDKMEKMDYCFIDRRNPEKVKEQHFNERAEMFSYIRGLYGNWRTFKTIEDIFVRFAMNPNDTYFNVSYIAPMNLLKCHDLRPFMAYENGKPFDIRLYKDEIEASSESLWHPEYKARGEHHHYDGVQFTSYVKTKHIKHYLRAAGDPEYGQWVRGSVSKRWWDWGEHYSYATRSWKSQTKSRKQWARHSKATIGRFVKQPWNANEIDFSDDECVEYI